MNRSPKKHQHISVCLAGAARTIVHPVVLQTHRHHLQKPLDADLFAVVNTQKNTAHSGLNKFPESALTRRGAERWRVTQALRVLGVLRFMFQEDEEMRPRNKCFGSRGAFTWPSMMWNVQRCGTMVRQYEEEHKFTYTWVVRARPDTFFRVPIRLPPVSDVSGGYYCKHNDAFFVASRSAAPAMFHVWDLIQTCDWVGDSNLSRRLPFQYQCGLQRKNIYANCIFDLAAYRHRLLYLGCEKVLNTHGRDFYRAHHCATGSCVTKGWTTRTPSVFFPMSVDEKVSDHGNLTLDDDIYEWGLSSGAILKGK